MKMNLNRCYSDMDILNCPACESEYLHQGKVEIYTGGSHITIHQNGWVDTDKNLTGNPEQGSDLLLVHFECEGCDEKTVLSISQYKGNTILKTGVLKTSISYEKSK